jgi:outer membrane autotransporter protein
MVVSNTAKDYVFGGTGGIAANASYVTGAVVNGYGLGKLVKLGPGRLAFQNNGANTFASGIDWYEGAISITNGNQLDVGADAALSLFAFSSTLQVEGAAAGVLASDIVFDGPSAGTLTVSNNSSRIEFSGVISGTGGIILTGTGVTALTGSNTYVGNTTLTAGSALAIGRDAALGAADNALVIAGHTRLEATGSFATTRAIDIGAHNLALAITGGNELTLAGAPGQLTGTGTVTLTGRLHVAGAGLLGATTHWDLAPASRLTLVGDQAVASLSNRGLITFSDREVLTTTGAFAGSGTISMKVDLNGGTNTPRLVVLGAATGEHVLDLTTVGDPGQPRLVNIPLIEVSAGDARFISDTFLSDDGMNAYEVRPSDTGFNFVFTGNSAAADVILVTAGALGMDWHYSFDNLRLRLGELRTIAAPSGLASATGDAKGAMGDVWFRASTHRIDAEAGVVGAAFKQVSYDITAGIDRAFAQGKGVFLLGGYASMTRSHRDHAIHSSESSSDGIGGGLYATWLRKSGWHLDLIAKYHSYENTVDARNDDRRVTRAEYNSDAFGGSIELGRRLQGRRLWFEPALQAGAGWFGSNEYTANSTSGKSMRISVDSATVWQYRAQLRGGADFGRWQPYVRIGEARNATSGGKVHSDPYEYTPNFDGWRFEAGAGFTLMVDERTMLYVDYEYNKAAEYERPWAFNLGFRRTW